MDIRLGTGWLYTNLSWISKYSSQTTICEWHIYISYQNLCGSFKQKNKKKQQQKLSSLDWIHIYCCVRKILICSLYYCPWPVDWFPTRATAPSWNKTTTSWGMIRACARYIRNDKPRSNRRTRDIIRVLWSNTLRISNFLLTREKKPRTRPARRTGSAKKALRENRFGVRSMNEYIERRDFRNVKCSRSVRNSSWRKLLRVKKLTMGLWLFLMCIRRRAGRSSHHRNSVP